MESRTTDLFDFIEAPLAAGTDGDGCNRDAGSSTACKPGEVPIDRDYLRARIEGCRANRLRIEKLAHLRVRQERYANAGQLGVDQLPRREPVDLASTNALRKGKSLLQSDILLLSGHVRCVCVFVTNSVPEIGPSFSSGRKGALQSIASDDFTRVSDEAIHLRLLALAGGDDVQVLAKALDAGGADGAEAGGAIWHVYDACDRTPRPGHFLKPHSEKQPLGRMVEFTNISDCVDATLRDTSNNAVCASRLIVHTHHPVSRLKAPAHAALPTLTALRSCSAVLRTVMDLARDGIIWTAPRSMSWWTRRWTLDFDRRPRASAISSKLGA